MGGKAVRAFALASIGTILLGLAVAAAAGLPVNGQSLQAGEDDDLRCDTDGVTLSYTVAWDNVDERFEISAFTVGGVAQPACASKEFRVRLTWAAPFGLSAYDVQTDNAATLVFSVTPPRPAEALIGWAIVMHN